MKFTMLRSVVFPVCTLALAAAASAQQVMIATSNPINPQLYTVDPVTGIVLTATPVSGHQALFGGLTRDGGDLYSIDGYNDGISDRTFRIDLASGVGTVVGDTGFNWNFRCVEIHPLTGVLYASRDNQLYTLDKTTGAATSVANLSAATLDQFTAFAIDSTGTGYGVDIGGIGLFSLDLSNGALTHLGDLGLTGFVQDLAFDGTDDLYAVLSGGGVYEIDIATVSATFQFPTGGWAGIAFEGCVSPTTYCTVGTTSSGCIPAIGSSGTPSASASSGFTLSCAGIDANASGVFFYGASNPGFVPLQWGIGGSSYYCVKSPTERTGVLDSGGTSGCSGSFSMDWNAFMATTPGALGNPRTAGASFDAQLWMRDPPNVKTTIFSDALRFTVCP